MKRSQPKSPRTARSFDIPIAIGVVVGLAGLLPPMLASAKSQEAGRSELAELHKLGVAQGLYTSETGGIPLSTLTLVKAGYVASDVCSSPVDLTPNGMANAITEDLGNHSELYLKLATDYRNSYVGLREFDFPMAWMNKYIKNDDGGGWLASLTASKKYNAEGNLVWASDTYRRLMLDGSAQVRHRDLVELPVGKDVMRADHSLFLFLDGTKEWKTSFISGSH